MNHNFANWEITQLLPEKNPFYKHDESYNEFQTYWFINNHSEDKTPYIMGENSLYVHECGEKYSYLRDAYSWECIRLYLLSKGYVIDIIYVLDREGEQLQWYFKVLTLSTYETDEDFIYYHTYEECREAAILFTLNELQK